MAVGAVALFYKKSVAWQKEEAAVNWNQKSSKILTSIGFDHVLFISCTYHDNRTGILTTIQAKATGRMSCFSGFGSGKTSKSGRVLGSLLQP